MTRCGVLTRCTVAWTAPRVYTMATVNSQPLQLTYAMTTAAYLGAMAEQAQQRQGRSWTPNQ